MTYATQMLDGSWLGVELSTDQQIQHLKERLDLKDTIMRAFGSPDSYKFFSEDDYDQDPESGEYTRREDSYIHPDIGSYTAVCALLSMMPIEIPTPEPMFESDGSTGLDWPLPDMQRPIHEMAIISFIRKDTFAACIIVEDEDGNELRFSRNHVLIFDVFNDPEFRNIMKYVVKKMLKKREIEPYSPCYKNVIDILKKEHEEELAETTKD